MDEELERILAHSRKTAERERRVRERHPSSTAKSVRCFEGINQRTCGHPNACTYYSAAFVDRCAMSLSSDITAEWVYCLLQDTGTIVPEAAIHPDPSTAVELIPNLCPVDESGAKASDSIVAQGTDALVRLVASQITAAKATARGDAGGCNGKGVIGLLIVNGTETFGVAVTMDGCVALFDPHGDSTQTEPSLCLVWGAGTSASDSALGVADFIDDRSHMAQEFIGEIVDVVIIARRPQQ